jgi:hypothetical protein
VIEFVVTIKTNGSREPQRAFLIDAENIDAATTGIELLFPHRVRRSAPFGMLPPDAAAEHLRKQAAQRSLKTFVPDRTRTRNVGPTDETRERMSTARRAWWTRRKGCKP